MNKILALNLVLHRPLKKKVVNKLIGGWKAKEPDPCDQKYLQVVTLCDFRFYAGIELKKKMLTSFCHVVFKVTSFI